MGDWIDMVHIYSGILLGHKYDILPFATIWMDLEKYPAKWNKSDGKRQEPYDFTPMWDIKTESNKWTTKQTQAQITV